MKLKWNDAGNRARYCGNRATLTASITVSSPYFLSARFEFTNFNVRAERYVDTLESAQELVGILANYADTLHLDYVWVPSEFTVLYEETMMTVRVRNEVASVSMEYDHDIDACKQYMAGIFEEESYGLRLALRRTSDIVAMVSLYKSDERSL